MLTSLLSPGLSLDRAASNCHRGTPCTLRPLDGFLQVEGGRILDADGGALNFSSFNTPNLHRIELGSGQTRVPTEYEQADALCTVQQLGGR